MVPPVSGPQSAMRTAAEITRQRQMSSSAFAGVQVLRRAMFLNLPGPVAYLVYRLGKDNVYPKPFFTYFSRFAIGNQLGNRIVYCVCKLGIAFTKADNV